MQKLQSCYQAAVVCSVLALVSGGSWLWLGNAAAPWSVWLFSLAFSAALVLNILTLGNEWSVVSATPPEFAQLAQAYLKRQQAVQLPTPHCYRSAAGRTLIWYCAEPSPALPVSTMPGLLCELKLHYQCERVEVLWPTPASDVNLLAILQADIRFIDLIELNRLK